MMKVGDKIFVYGSLLSGLHNNRLLQGANLIGKDVIKGFRMYSMGSFPAIFKSTDDISIKGEVWEIDSPERATALDSLEGYPHFYNREVVTTKGDIVTWVYFVENPRDLEEVPEGDWRKYLGIGD
jgi:gamma-glutamylcyclotransferase (GGCT)/AIG2-like uncharacterized protein YtfP